MLIHPDGIARERPSIARLPRWKDADTIVSVVSDASGFIQPMREVQRAAVESALILCEGNRKKAASALGISRNCMQDWIKSFRAEDVRTTCD